MKTNNNRHGSSWSHTILVALIFIVVGILFLGRNLGFISSSVFKQFVSWQMLLIVLGISALGKRNTTGGLILIAIGVYFMAPFSFGWYWLQTYWPVVFIILGIHLIYKHWKRMAREGNHNYHMNYTSSNCQVENGVLSSEVTFGAIQQIVLEPVFRGGTIKNTFGSTVIDLKNTSIPQGETQLDIHCVFGAVELFVPSDWNVVFHVDSVLSGYVDKRFNIVQTDDPGRTLLITGKIVFSGLDIRS